MVHNVQSASVQRGPSHADIKMRMKPRFFTNGLLKHKSKEIIPLLLVPLELVYGEGGLWSFYFILFQVSRVEGSTASLVHRRLESHPWDPFSLWSRLLLCNRTGIQTLQWPRTWYSDQTGTCNYSLFALMEVGIHSTQANPFLSLPFF